MRTFCILSGNSIVMVELWFFFLIWLWWLMQIKVWVRFWKTFCVRENLWQGFALFFCDYVLMPSSLFLVGCVGDFSDIFKWIRAKMGHPVVEGGPQMMCYACIWLLLLDSGHFLWICFLPSQAIEEVFNKLLFLILIYLMFFFVIRTHLCLGLFIMRYKLRS